MGGAAMGYPASQVAEARKPASTGGQAQSHHAPGLPRVSVVVPSVTGLPIVAECLQTLIAQEGAAEMEILVLDRCGEAIRAVLRGRFPQVQVIAVEGQPSIPALRALGIERAKGPIIALLEDHCLAQPGWLRAIEKAFATGRRAIGGPVENGSTDRLVDWAAFFCEYARFCGPVPHGIVPDIPGNNAAFDRQLLQQLQPELRAEVWEPVWLARIRQWRVAFHSVPEMAVLHKMSFRYGDFLVQRYHYSRSFAGMRLRGAAWWTKTAYAAGTLFLPGLLLGRLTVTMIRKRRCWQRFLCSLPVLLTFLVSWAVGEGVGALLGPGRSLKRVR
jgi:glycosyltransferase involved in cell wall biosynthesis